MIPRGEVEMNGRCRECHDCLDSWNPLNEASLIYDVTCDLAKILDSWTNESESEASEISTKSNQQFLKRKISEDGITAEILDALSEKQEEALAENLNERCKNLQFDESLTKAAAILLPEEMGAQHLDRFIPIACLTMMRKLVGYLRLMTLGKIKCASFQTAFVKNSHPLQGTYSILMAAEKENEWDIPLIAAQIDLKKSVSTMCTETKH